MNDPEKPLPDHLQRLLKNSPTHTPPERFYQRVLGRIEERQRPVVLFAHWPKMAAAACAVLLTVVVVRHEKETPLETVSPSVAVKEEAMVSNPLPVAPAHQGVAFKDSPAPIAKKARAVTGFVAQAPSADMDRADEVSARRENVALGLSAAGASVAQPREWNGASSGIKDRREVIVRNAADWESLWRQHAVVFVPQPDTPYVDFSRDMVVGVWTGNKPSTGYAVRIVDVRDEGTRQRVIYQEIAPTAGMATGAALTQPYILRVIPRSDDPVRFEIRAD